MAGLTGCAQAPQPAAPEPPIAPPPHADARFSDEQAAVAEAYERFWVVSRGLPQHPAERWRPELEQVAAGSMAETILDNLGHQREHRIVLYGEVHPRISDVRLGSDRAVVTDCQDSSSAGQADASSGEPKTVGVARNPVSGSLQRGPNGAWRVTRIDYPKGVC